MELSALTRQRITPQDAAHRHTAQLRRIIRAAFDVGAKAMTDVWSREPRVDVDDVRSTTLLFLVVQCLA